MSSWAIPEYAQNRLRAAGYDPDRIIPFTAVQTVDRAAVRPLSGGAAPGPTQFRLDFDYIRPDGDVEHVSIDWAPGHMPDDPATRRTTSVK